MITNEVAPRTASTRVAAVMAEIGAPWVSNVLGSIAVAALARAPWWGVVLIFLTAILPMAVIFAAIEIRGGGDHHVSDRSQRPLILLLILILQVIGVVVEAVAGAPRLIVVSTAVGVVALIVCGLITAALKWKVSLHVAVPASMVLFLAVAGSSWLWLVLFVWVALIGWSRVVLRAHTLMQVLVGFVCGVVSAAVTLPFL